MSSDYLEIKTRRAAQFAHYIRLMDDRAHEIAANSCMLIICDSRGQDSSAEPALEVEAFVEQPSALQMGNWPGAPSPPGDGEAWRPDSSGRQRFVQFSFEENWFCLDMPNATLNRAEGERIIRDRTGFFWLENRPEFTLAGEDVEGWDPFRKVYVYGDEEAAGDDTAHIFFAVWNFPVDATLYVTAASFDGKHKWEDDHPIS